ncbi:MAG TPA: PhzF family phenazine biosynthesis isomerase [Steroidobacteraceae bacterium]|jgi:PhzF family phenazine biosynthesis protein|nr:PhzF family phenazine biosynthesis isomerase [Steroidobacteraceae bacterium]
MSRRVEIFQVDAFTSTRFAGNPAGVVLNADCLQDAEMQALARELNNADTAFVLRPTDDDHDIRVRFFTPRSEAAFVGHATLAVHAVLNGAEPQPLRRQMGKTGIVQVRALEDGGFAIRQPPAPLGRWLSGEELSTVLAALGLTHADLDPQCPARIIGTASTRLLLGIRVGTRLAALTPDLATLARLSADLGAAGYFLYSRTPSVPDCQVESRMFCPALGIPEDPVSGNAHGMLGVYLLDRGLLQVSGRQLQFTGAQGHHLGRPGKVGIVLQVTDIARGSICEHVEIRGQAVLVFSATLTL